MKIVQYALAFSFLFASAVFAAESKNLFSSFDGKSVKVYVTEVKDSTKEHETAPAVLKTKIEDALKNRKSITFHIVSAPQDADILIDADIQEFMWTDHDPVDMLIGTAAVAYDIATVEDYARLQADISVTDVKSKKVLWREKVMGTITKKPMSRAESIPLVAENFAKAFVKQCFSKKRG